MENELDYRDLTTGQAFRPVKPFTVLGVAANAIWHKGRLKTAWARDSKGRKVSIGVGIGRLSVVLAAEATP
jgi:hypothetical protein